MISAQQQAIVERSPESRLFLEGPAGAGKTFAAVERLRRLLASGVPASSILVLVPQRTLAAPYEEALRSPGLGPGGEVTILTVGGLAQRMVDLFWPLVAETACFADPERPPTFLTLETAQYHMACLVRPLFEQGYFETITVERNRIYSQILDNLNKAAVVGFPHTEIAERLKMAWLGDKTQLRVYDEAQDCAVRFREYCLAHNLLDFSLQYEVFVHHLWPLPVCRDYLLERYTHLIVDNVEEDTAAAHDLLRDWLPACRSALLVYDWDAGYRRFLGADPGGARTLADLCGERIALRESFVASPALRYLGRRLGYALGRNGAGQGGGTTRGGEGGETPPLQMRLRTGEALKDDIASPPPSSLDDIRSALTFEYHRYHPQMIDWVAGEIDRLVRGEGVAAGQIVVLAPFLTDALRFLLAQALERYGIAVRSHRPSRALREEPATRCLLTLAALAYPAWQRHPPLPDVAHALRTAIAGLDLVRAQLLTGVVYRYGAGELGSFDRLDGEMQERITYLLGGRYEQLRTWLAEYAAGAPDSPALLDHFLSRLFGEVLSQPGYGFHRSFDAGEVAANLIESVRKFRQVTENGAVGDTGNGGAAEYIRMVEDGVVAAQYVRSWRLQPDDAVLLAPAYTFLMSNRPVDYQFWIDVGSPGWWERLNQPLTQPYVLSRAWAPGTLWGDRQEYEARQDALYSLVAGLIRRCRHKIYLGLSELSEDGTEQQGPLLRAVQQVLRRAGSPGP